MEAESRRSIRLPADWVGGWWEEALDWVEGVVRGRDRGAAGRGEGLSARNEGRGWGRVYNRTEEMTEETEEQRVLYMFEKRRGGAYPDRGGLNPKGQRTST